MTQAMSLVADLQGVRRACSIVGVIGTIALVAGAFIDRDQFFQSYLTGYLLVIGPALGSLALLFLHGLTGGAWGYSIRRILQAGARTIPALALLFVPLCFGLHSLFEWSHADVLEHDPILQHKAGYLNVPFFYVRAVVYFAAWFLLSRALLGALARSEAQPGEATQRKLRSLGGLGLAVYVLTMSFASFDWAMSLEPHWFSHVYGVKAIIGQVLTTWCVVILVARRLARYEPFSSSTTKANFHDLGNLTMAFTMLWAYIGFSEYLIIWSGNLPEETPYLLHRTQNGWQFLAVALVIFHFAVPFLVLLARQNKRLKERLVWIAGGILVMRTVDLQWLIAPAFHHHGLHVSWMDAAAFLGLGGLWGWIFLGRLLEGSLVPPEAAVVTPEVEHA